MNQPHKAVPVIIRNAQRRGSDAASEGDERRPWWTSSS